MFKTLWQANPVLKTLFAELKGSEEQTEHVERRNPTLREARAVIVRKLSNGRIIIKTA